MMPTQAMPSRYATRPVTTSLEHIARQITSRPSQERSSPASILELQISFWLEQLDIARLVHQETLRSLFHSELYVGTDLAALDCYDPVLFHARTGARDRLTDKLLRLAEERRHVMINHVREDRMILERLVELLAQHGTIAPPRHSHPPDAR